MLITMMCMNKSIYHWVVNGQQWKPNIAQDGRSCQSSDVFLSSIRFLIYSCFYPWLSSWLTLRLSTNIHLEIPAGGDLAGHRHVRLWSKVGQIGLKWDKSGNFSDETVCQNLLRYDPKKSRICHIWGQSDPLWERIWHPCWLVTFKQRCQIDRRKNPL